MYYKVHYAASEENPVSIDCGGSGFSVGFDPLDGSSIIDCNFSVGTILGIWPNDASKEETTLIGRSGRELCCSMMVQYGPRVTIILAVSPSLTSTGQSLCLEMTMLANGWILSKPQLAISPKGKTFAPGNLRATADNEGYRNLVNYCTLYRSQLMILFIYCTVLTFFTLVCFF